MSDPLPLEWNVVPRDVRPRRLMVLLHGYAQPTAELADRVGQIDPDGTCCVVVPEAPFRSRGRAVWHAPMASGDDDRDRAAEGQLMASTVALDALLGRLECELGYPADEALVGGFSQGGGVAITQLLWADTTHRPAAAFGVCSFPPMVRGFAVDRAATAGWPCFLASARRDRFAPIEMSRSCAVMLRDVGLGLTYVETDGEHEMTDGAADLIGRWVRSLDGDDPVPSDPVLDAVAGSHPGYDGLWVDAPS